MTATVTPDERANIVSGLAKGFRIDQIASSLKVPTAAVIALRNEYGTDLGQLATAAEQLRTDLGSRHPTADDTLILSPVGRVPQSVIDAYQAARS